MNQHGLADRSIDRIRSGTDDFTKNLVTKGLRQFHAALFHPHLAFFTEIEVPVLDMKVGMADT